MQWIAAVLCVAEFGVHLAELTVEPQGALAIRQVRSIQILWSGAWGAAGVAVYLETQWNFTISFPGLQLASVILKQYVETHWCSQSEKFRPPETTDRVSRRCHSQRRSLYPRRVFPNVVQQTVLSLCTPGQSRYQRAAAERPAGGHQQSPLQRGVRRVRYRPLGLARGLAAALHPADGDAGQRGCQCCAWGHEGPHRSVATLMVFLFLLTLSSAIFLMCRFYCAY